MVSTVRTARWNPVQIRRCVRLHDATTDGVVIFATKSFTSEDAEDKWHPLVDVVTGNCSCDCPDWRYRKEKNHPTVSSPEEDMCKHLRRAVANLKRRGLVS